MCFRNLFPQYYDCDTEFRLAWVQQKFIESQVDSDFKTPIVNWGFLWYCLKTGASGEVKDQSLQLSAPSSLPGNQSLWGQCQFSQKKKHISSFSWKYFFFQSTRFLVFSRQYFLFQCDKTSIAKALNSPLPFNDPLDGLLIYHRRVKTIFLIWIAMDWKFDHVGTLHAWQDTTGGVDQGLHGAWAAWHRGR